MMKLITIKVNDRDYAALIRHLANGRLGRPTVCVERLIAIDDDEQFDLQEELVAIEPIEEER